MSPMMTRRRGGRRTPRGEWGRSSVPGERQDPREDLEGTDGGAVAQDDGNAFLLRLLDGEPLDDHEVPERLRDRLFESRQLAFRNPAVEQERRMGLVERAGRADPLDPVPEPPASPRSVPRHSRDIPARLASISRIAGGSSACLRAMISRASGSGFSATEAGGAARRCSSPRGGLALPRPFPPGR